MSTEGWSAANETLKDEATYARAVYDALILSKQVDPTEEYCSHGMFKNNIY